MTGNQKIVYFTLKREKSSELIIMPKKIIMLGKVFGLLTVIKFSHKGRFGELFWDTLCECGGKTSVLGRSLRSGNTKSCGCLHRKIVKEMFSGSKNCRWNGGKTTGNGYVYFLRKGHHRANSYGYVSEHVLVAENLYIPKSGNSPRHQECSNLYRIRRKEYGRSTEKRREKNSGGNDGCHEGGATEGHTAAYDDRQTSQDILNGLPEEQKTVAMHTTELA